MSYTVTLLLFFERFWNPATHPRFSKGSKGGGKFKPKSGVDVPNLKQPKVTRKSIKPSPSPTSKIVKILPKSKDLIPTHTGTNFNAYAPPEDNTFISPKSGTITKAPHDPEVALTTAKTTAKKLGFDPNKVSVRTDDHVFELDGKKCTSSGLYYKNKGTIEIFPHRISPGKIDGVVAHEIMHHKWGLVYDEYRAQENEIVDLAYSAKNKKKKPNPVLSPDDTPRPPYDKQFPVYNALCKYFNDSEEAERLKDEDGCSSYSLDCWAEHNKSKNTLKLDSAVSETLSEMARLDLETNGKFNDISRLQKGGVWRDFYDSVNTLYDDL